MPLFAVYVMKICLIILINLFFGFVGYTYKSKIKKEIETLGLIKDFLTFYETNITLYKNDTHEIFNNYIIMQKNKNAKLLNIFSKNNQCFKINEEILKDNVSDLKTNHLIIKYFSTIGMGDYLFEKEKLSNFKNVISEKIILSEKQYKEKGEVFFRIMIAIGMVLSILIW